MAISEAMEVMSDLAPYVLEAVEKAMVCGALAKPGTPLQVPA